MITGLIIGLVVGFIVGGPFWMWLEHDWHASQPGWLRTTAKKYP